MFILQLLEQAFTLNMPQQIQRTLFHVEDKDMSALKRMMLGFFNKAQMCYISKQFFKLMVFLESYFPLK